jgi:hypothetical protein
MADKQRFPQQAFFDQITLRRVLKFGGDCMERFVRFIAWLTTFSSGL